MPNPKSDLATELGKLVNTYTWLVADFFLFLLLATFFLGYKDFDLEMQRFVRGAFIFSMWFFCVSGLHILIIIHLYNQDKEVPGWISYPLFLMKPLLIGGLFLWANSQNLL
jgi:hypothetical protein